MKNNSLSNNSTQSDDAGSNSMKTSQPSIMQLAIQGTTMLEAINAGANAQPKNSSSVDEEEEDSTPAGSLKRKKGVPPSDEHGNEPSEPKDDSRKKTRKNEEDDEKAAKKAEKAAKRAEAKAKKAEKDARRAERDAKDEKLDGTYVPDGNKDDDDESSSSSDEEKTQRRRKRWTAHGMHLNAPLRVDASTDESDHATRLRTLAGNRGIPMCGTRDRIDEEIKDGTITAKNGDHNLHNEMKM